MSNKKILTCLVVVLGALCAAPSARAAGHCATLYEDINFGGEHRDVDDGENVSWIGHLWNDQVSSMRVEPGCVLNAWEHVSFGGDEKTFLGSVPWVGDPWNDRISSYTCSCHGAGARPPAPHRGALHLAQIVEAPKDASSTARSIVLRARADGNCSP
jgi:hypothetical protein